MKNQPAPACENCAHAQQGEPDPNNIGAPRPLLCRRYPPAVTMIHLGGGNVAAAAASPTVPPSGLCGEWESLN